MKQFIILIISALLLASPIAVARNSCTASALLDMRVKKEKKTVTYNVNMHCKNCVAKITDNVSFVKGVEDLKVSLDEKTVTITYDPAKTDEATLQKAIEKLGYTAEKVNPDDKR
jgi:copper chaperone CopZ